MNKQSKIRYDLNEAIQHILEPGSESELSDLELSSDEEDDNNLFLVTHINDEISICEEEQCMTADILLEDEINIEFTTPDKPNTNEKTSSSTLPKPITHNYKWCNKRPPIRDTTFSGCEFSLPPNNVDTFTPLIYFQMFWKDTLFTLLAEQTNLYSVQISSKSVNVTETELKQFIAIQMYMSIFKLPAYYMYWSTETRYPKIADLISDNSRLNDPVNKHNKIYKIAPVLDHVRQNCLSIEPETGHSIDEQIIPAKTRYSGIRQYNPKKPVKWGFKIFVRSGISGIRYDFFLYTGAAAIGSEKCNGSYVVKRLIESFPKNQNFKLCFDNWFCSLGLCLHLNKLGILTTATIRNDRMQGCYLPTESEMRKKGRGSHAYKCDINSGIIIPRWYDIKCVNLCSTYCDPDSISDVKRWNRTEKNFVNINCPLVVKEYNQCMGGVDLCDMLISLYRTNIKTKRCLSYAEKPLVAVGRQSKRKLCKDVTPQKRKNSIPLPNKDIQLDCLNHWPEHREKKLNCRLCFFIET
ncbi:piggyBac transposable element-derived protein 3-like [Hydra vulgaris]|uniref:PiggyBac transposable element-derived protein 3-like n=1 Tax=Hydra vulgaris TaxID=6087 RepID=A0ABM4DCG4_HYDVU